MNFQVQLYRGIDIVRDTDGVPSSWRKGDKIAEFSSANSFISYVREHAKELADAVAFSGSAGLLGDANAFITDELRKVKLL